MAYRREYKNTAEEAFCKFIENMGYAPIKRGWPDFFCTTKDGKIMAVEVKPDAGNYLKVEQLLVLAHLAEHGIPSYRWNPQTRTLQPVKTITQLKTMGSGQPTGLTASAMPHAKRSDRR